jgi:uroporphyrinogen decarboxylase
LSTFFGVNSYYLHFDEIARFPFDGIRFGDDWGAQRGMLMGPNRWRQFLKPRLAKIFDKARRQGLVVMVHSDGDIMEIIPDLIEIGVQILNPIQPESMDIFKIKRLFGCFA